MQIQPETIIWNTPSPASRPAAIPAKPAVFRLEMSGDDRINGSIPVWGAPKTPEEEISAGLAEAAKPAGLPASAASLAATEETKPADEGFGLADIIDMINPLQHLPVIGSIYRSITGDDIKPVSRVVGGAAFGGPIGAASGVVNALVQMETGKDLGENVMASFEGRKNSAPAENDTTLAVANLRLPQPHYNS